MIHIIVAIAVWRITSLFVAEAGPFKIFLKLRNAVKPYTKVLTCFWCFSIWVGLVFALWSDNVILYWLFYSGVAIFIDEALRIFDLSVEDKKDVR